MREYQKLSKRHYRGLVLSIFLFFSFFFLATRLYRILLITTAAFYKNVAISQINAVETVLFVTF